MVTKLSHLIIPHLTVIVKGSNDFECRLMNVRRESKYVLSHHRDFAYPTMVVDEWDFCLVTKSP